jgi:TNF receptor-associated protein 1
VSVEKEVRRGNDDESEKLFKTDDNVIGGAKDGLSKKDTDDLVRYIKTTLGNKVQNVKYTSKLENHPCVVTVEDMAAARHFIKMQSHQLSEENRYALLQAVLEINPK